MSSLSLNPHLQIKEEPAKQGIVTILPFDSEKTTSTTKQSSTTIRRTLSADIMSSKKFLLQNAFASHQEIAIPHDNSSSSSSGDTSDQNRPGQDEIWRSIQSQKEKLSDVWGTNSVILTQKSSDTASDLPPPYIHPLVRKSGNTLNEKSLEICTENLGSETGSDGFSPSDDDGDEDINNNKEEEEEEAIIINLFEVVKYNKRSPVRAFPPPLPSIDGAASLQMQSHRKNGRLVVEAVSVPSRNCFHSQRKDGRLVLTMAMINTPKNNIHVKEEVTSLPNGGLLKNPTSFRKFNKTVNMMEADEEEAAVLVPKSLPMPPRVPRMITSPPPQCATTATFNTYNYFWRNTNTVSGGRKDSYNNKKAAYEHHQDLVLMRRNKTEYYMKGCKEGRRRSVSIWEPYCIATT